MAFSLIIAHRITRTTPTAGTTTQVRTDAFEVNGKLDELAYELKSIKPL